MKALASLVRNFDFKKVALLTSNEPHHKMLSEKLVESLKKTMLNLMREEHDVYRIEFSTAPVSVDRIDQIVNDVNILGSSFIIVLANEEVTELIFKIAQKYDMLGLDTTWVLIEFNHERIFEKIPMRILNICMKEDARHDWNENQIASIIANVR